MHVGQRSNVLSGERTYLLLLLRKGYDNGYSSETKFHPSLQGFKMESKEIADEPTTGQEVFFFKN